MATSPIPQSRDDDYYPSSDGKPIGESTWQVQAILGLMQVLQEYFQNRPDVFIAGDLFWYWEEGNPRSCTAPDVMVVKGVGNHHRTSFFAWKEKISTPHVVFGVASEGNWREDLGEKKVLYARLGVPEYFVFDPQGKYLQPALQGFRQANGRYEEMARDDQGRLFSEELGLSLQAEKTLIRFWQGRGGEKILTSGERAVQLEAEVAQLRALLEKKKSDSE